MQFFHNRKDIRNLLFTEYEYKTKDIKGVPTQVKRPQYGTGVYVISRDANDTTYKVGMSRNLYKRLTDYKLCFPYSDEFYVHYIIKTKDTDSAFAVEKAVLDRLRNNKVKVEKDRDKTRHKTSDEYKIVAKITALKMAINSALRDNDDWKLIAVFNQTKEKKMRYKVIEHGKQVFKANDLNKPSMSRGYKSGNLENIFIKIA